MTCTLKETQILYTSVVFFTCDGNLRLQKEENPLAAFVLLLQRFNECAIVLKPANSLYYMLTQVLKENFAALFQNPPILQRALSRFWTKKGSGAPGDNFSKESHQRLCNLLLFACKRFVVPCKRKHQRLLYQPNTSQIQKGLGMGITGPHSGKKKKILGKKSIKFFSFGRATNETWFSFLQLDWITK